MDEWNNREPVPGEPGPLAETEIETPPIEAPAPSEEDAPPAPEETPAEAPRPSAWRELVSWVLWMVIPVAVVLLLNAFVFKLVRVSGDSMFPTLHNRDILVVWQLGAPEQGDIVVFHEGGAYLVKRMIAGEGQTVVIDYLSNDVFVDDARQDETYINRAEDDPMEDKGETVFDVPAGCIFVMGDNRNHSADSRSHIGYIDCERVVGPAILHIPLGRWLESIGR